MATQPLFAADLPTLLKELRLATLASSSDAQSVVNMAMLAVRTGFLRKLGKDRVVQIQGYTATENPLTDEEIVRATARVVEVNWMRYELMGRLPMLFMDASGDAEEVFNEEPAFRQLAASDVEDKRAKLWAEILESLELLGGDEEVGEPGGHAKVFTPDPSKVFAPGASIGAAEVET